MRLFSHSVMSDSLWPHGQQHIRLPCPSLSPVIYSNSCLLSWWCHPAISSSVTTFFSCPQSFSALGAFPMSWLLASGGQNTGASASASVLPMNVPGWLYDWLVWFPCSRRDSQESYLAPPFKSINLRHSSLFMVQLTSVHDYWKNHSFDCTERWSNSAYILKVNLLLF